MPQNIKYCSKINFPVIYLLYSIFHTLYLILSYCIVQVVLHMRTYWTFKDVKGVTHKNGEEWLIKMADTEAHIPDVYKEVLCM